MHLLKTVLAIIYQAHLSARHGASAHLHELMLSPHLWGRYYYLTCQGRKLLPIKLVTSCSRSHGQPGRSLLSLEGRLLDLAAGTASHWANAPGVKGSGGDPQSQEGCVNPTDRRGAGGLLAYCLVSLTGMMVGLGGT